MGARSRLWLQIKADVLQRPIKRVLVAESACLGAAMLGAVASGHFSSLDEAACTMVSAREQVDPNSEHRVVYEEGYAGYIELYERLAPMFR